MHWLWYTLPLVCAPGLERALRGPCPPVVDPPPDVRRVLAVAAHPDDLEYFCGGLLGRFARSGARVDAVLATGGERGGETSRRRAEQEEAARLLGYAGLHWLGFPDRGVRHDDPRLLAKIHALTEVERPHLLLTFDPDHPYPIYAHPDHLAVARAALSVWRGPAWLFHTRRPDIAVDITEAFAAKLAAFGAHRSQLPRRGTAQLAGWHLQRRHRQGKRFLELYRTIPPQRVL